MYQRYSSDSKVWQKRRQGILALEDYFCARSWVAAALGEYAETTRMWRAREDCYPDSPSQTHIKHLLTLIHKIEPFAPDPAQVGWWLVCRHFRLAETPAKCALDASWWHRRCLSDLVALAHDDFLRRVSPPSPCDTTARYTTQ
jgi:hypothetical protein